MHYTALMIEHWFILAGRESRKLQRLAVEEEAASAAQTPQTLFLPLPSSPVAADPPGCPTLCESIRQESEN